MSILKLTYQKKVRLLPWMAVGVVICIYLLAVSETLRLRKEMQLLKHEALIAGNNPKRLHQLVKRLDEVNNISGDKTSGMVTDPLLEMSSKLALENGAILSEYQPVHIFNYGNHQLETRIVSFEAPFIPCLKVLFNLEKSYRHGKVVSVSYFTRTDFKTSKKHLNMQVLIQTIQNENNDSKTSE